MSQHCDRQCFDVAADWPKLIRMWCNMH